MALSELAFFLLSAFIFIVAPIFIASSVSTVEPIQYGLVYNKVTRSIDSENIYSGGLYFIGFTSRFIRFPAAQETIEFSEHRFSDAEPLTTRTKEGLAIKIYLTFQYQLIKEKLPDLYKQSTTNYEATFVRIARDMILQTAGEYEASQYWQNRTLIRNEMEVLLDEALQQAYANCKGLQLLKIVLPKKFEKSIVDTQVEVQMTNMRELEQKAEIIRQETSVLVSDSEKEMTTMKAEADAKAYFLKEQSKAISKRKSLDMQTWVYQQIRSVLKFNETEFREYIRLTSIEQQKNAVLLVGSQSNNYILNIA